MTDTNSSSTDVSEPLVTSYTPTRRPDVPLPWDTVVADDGFGRTVWRTARRHIPLVAFCAAASAVAGFVVTSRLPHLYETSISIRVDPKAGPLSSLNLSNAPADNAIATELEMLRSRALIRSVVDSTGFRLLLTPGIARARPPRSSVMTGVHVADDAVTGAYKLSNPGDNDELELWHVQDQELITRIKPGKPATVRGVTFTLLPDASANAPIEFFVLSPDDAVDSLKAWTTVARRGREADLLDLRVRGPDPALIRDIANAFGRFYIASHEDARELEAKHAVEFLRDRLTTVSRQLTGAEQALRDYRSRARVVSLPDEASTGIHHRAELLAQRNAINAERVALTRLLPPTTTAGNDAGAKYRELMGFPTLLRSEASVALQSALIAAEQKRSELVTHRTERDAEVKALDARIAELHTQLRGLVTTYVQGLTNQVQALDTTLSQSNAELATFPEKEMRQAELERTAKNTEAVYAMLQERFKEAEIAAAAKDESIRLVDSAVLPRRPVSPKPLLTVALALAAGIAIGLVGAFVRESSDQSLRTRSQLLALTGSPVLSLIPRLHGMGAIPSRLSRLSGRRTAIMPVFHSSDPAPRALVGSGGGRSAPTYSANDLFGFAESYARLVTNLGFTGQAQPVRVVLVTSALAGDGKTTVATNLALTLSREGKRVLLIDGDLRGGRIAGMLGVSLPFGVGEVLMNTSDLASAIAEVPAGGRSALHVLARGSRTVTDPAALLGSDASRDLLTRARALYDMVVIDTPPVNSVADAALLSRHCDGVLVVARAGTTAREALVFAMEQLRIVRAPVIGAVLNDVDLRRDVGVDAAYQYYGQYHSGSAA
jgi:succinoglycan biosynthesis transport protein ExoP